jgi:predicted nucleotidyltransferase
MDKIKSDKIKWRNIVNLFRDYTQRLFKDNLIFAFIGGSFAKNKMKKDSDIDMFVCLEERDTKKEIIFRKWYLKIHKQHGLKPDKKFFAEVIALKELDVALKYIKNFSPIFLIREKRLYDAFAWAGIIVADKVAFVGQKKVFTSRKKKLWG